MQTLGGKEKRHAGFGLFAGLMRGKEKKMKPAGPRDWQQALGGCVVGPVSVCWALPSGLAAAAKRSKLDPNWAQLKRLTIIKNTNNKNDKQREWKQYRYTELKQDTIK